MSAAVVVDLPDRPDAPDPDDVRSPSLWRATMRRREAQIGMVLGGTIVALAVVGPFLAPHGPNEFLGRPFTRDGGTFGVDVLGRDVLSRFLHGGRSILFLTLASAILGTALGAALGLACGSSRSRLSEAAMRGVDLLLAFPQGVLALVFVTRLGPRWWLLLTIISVAHAPRVARVLRAATAEVMERDFVQAARALGTRRRTLLASEVLPHVTGPLMVELGLSIVFSAGIISALSFLGFGTQPPAVDWGVMVRENQVGLARQPWGVLLPVGALAALTVGANLVTDSIAKAVARLENGGGTR